MRARLILALVALTAACKSKSEDKASPPTGGAQPPPGPGAAAGGSGSPGGAGSSVATSPDPSPAPIVGGAPLEQSPRPNADAKPAPDVPTSKVGADGFQAAAPRGDTTMERRPPEPAAPAPAGDPSAAPAVPTPAARADGIAVAPVNAGATTGRVAIAAPKALDDSTLTTDAVTAKIRAAYLAGVRRCGEGKAGAVELAFTVGESGRVVAATAPAAFDPEVASCIVTKAKAWVFRVPTSTASMNPAKARFALTFTLGS
jgi:hypothetical protein